MAQVPPAQTPAQPPAPYVVAAPRSAREVAGLTVRRDLLRQQLDRAEEHRSDLSGQLRDAGADRAGRAYDEAAVVPIRAGLEARLKEADARVLQLERDIAATERALTQAGPEVLAQYEQERPRPPEQRGPEEGEVFGLMLLAFLAGMFVLTLARRIRAGRRRHRGLPDGAPDGAPAGAGPDPRIDRLSQAVDAIAVEVERIGEGQRFVTQLLAERRELLPADAGRTADVPGAR